MQAHMRMRGGPSTRGWQCSVAWVRASSTCTSCPLCASVQSVWAPASFCSTSTAMPVLALNHSRSASTKPITARGASHRCAARRASWSKVSSVGVSRMAQACSASRRRPGASVRAPMVSVPGGKWKPCAQERATSEAGAAAPAWRGRGGGWTGNGTAGATRCRKRVIQGLRVSECTPWPPGTDVTAGWNPCRKQQPGGQYRLNRGGAAYARPRPAPPAPEPSGRG